MSERDGPAHESQSLREALQHRREGDSVEGDRSIAAAVSKFETQYSAKRGDFSELRENARECEKIIYSFFPDARVISLPAWHT